MLGYIVDLFEFLLLLRVLFLKKLLLELLDVLLDLFQHPSDLELIIREVVYKHSLVSRDLLHSLLFILVSSLFLLVIRNRSLTILDELIILIMVLWCSLGAAGE